MIAKPPIIVSDVHGHHEQLTNLVRFFRRKGYLRDRRLTLLGDTIDRGFNSRMTLDLVADLVEEGHSCYKGNHEFVLESALGLVPSLSSYLRLAWVRRWATRYEAGTLASYGLNSPLRNAPLEEWVAAADALREAMPERHKRLISEMPWFGETQNLILVHAGISSDVSWEEQRTALVGGLRNDPCGPAQIFGHGLTHETPTKGNRNWPKRIVSGHGYVPKPVITPTRVLLNCGVDLGGPLVAWVSDTGEVFAADSFNGKIKKLEGEDV